MGRPGYKANFKLYQRRYMCIIINTTESVDASDVFCEQLGKIILQDCSSVSSCRCFYQAYLTKVAQESFYMYDTDFKNYIQPTHSTLSYCFTESVETYSSNNNIAQIIYTLYMYLHL